MTHAAWIFDLDGTLTVAAHDFDAIRAELGLPEGRPILESLAELEASERAALEVRLRAIERAVAERARAAAGAAALIDALVDRGVSVGIVTRNTRDNARVTLAAAGLAHHFADAFIVGRDEAPAKPDPAGIRWLLTRWGVAPARASMVGDFRFDLIAGRAAGARAVYVDPSGEFVWRAFADRCVRRLDELLPELGERHDPDDRS